MVFLSDGADKRLAEVMTLSISHTSFLTMVKNYSVLPLSTIKDLEILALEIRLREVAITQGSSQHHSDKHVRDKTIHN